MERSIAILRHYDMGRVSELADMVRLGAKPVASITIRKEDAEEVAACVRQFDTIAYRCFNRGDNHIAMFLYQSRYPHLFAVVNWRNALPHDGEAVMAWVNGKMFGYSEDAIAQFVSDAHLLDQNQAST